MQPTETSSTACKVDGEGSGQADWQVGGGASLGVKMLSAPATLEEFDPVLP